jgi:enamine deaminase RidA (YjgF/YER057c/UK114 family)
MVATAGEVADDWNADITVQTQQTLAKIDALLIAAGTSKHELVAGYVWLSDISDFNAMNAVWEAWVVPGKTPVRACVEAKLADPRLKVEIQVFAVKD